MSDLGTLFRWTQSALASPIENFTTAALSIAVNRDARPMVTALSRVDLADYRADTFHVLQLFRDTTRSPVRMTGEIQRMLDAVDGVRLGFLDLVLTVDDAVRSEIWVEVKVDAPESGDQLDVYRRHARCSSLKADVITLGRTRITSEVPFLTWRGVIEAIDATSEPHYTWLALREFLLDEKIVRPIVRGLPRDTPACVDAIVSVNAVIREIWPNAGLAWTEGTLRKVLGSGIGSDTATELLTTGGPLVYGLALVNDSWEWCLRFSVGTNYQHIRLDPRTVLEMARDLPNDWLRAPDRLELLERRLAPGDATSHDEVVAWFHEGLRQLHEHGLLRPYLAGLAEKRAKTPTGTTGPMMEGGLVEPMP